MRFRGGVLLLRICGIATLLAASDNLGAQGTPLSFTDISAIAGLSAQSGSHGAAFADMNDDGRPDLYLTYNHVREGPRRNLLYRNVDGVHFAEETALRGAGNYGNGSHGVVWADFDNDRDFDLVIGSTYNGVGQMPPSRVPEHQRPLH